MAAGDLENIVMTVPDSTMHSSSRVRNIIWRDHNNVNRSVKYVYWCPDGQRARLVWQRDHTPVQDNFIELSDNQILFKWVATSNTITSVKHWCKITGQYYVNLLTIFKSDGTLLTYQDNAEISLTDSTLLVNGQTISVKVAELTNLNINVTQGETYYICLTRYNNQSYLKPYAYNDISGDYWTVPISLDWQLKQSMQSGNYQSHSDYKIKAEVNGVQV